MAAKRANTTSANNTVRGEKSLRMFPLADFLRGPGTALVGCGCVDASAELYKDAKQVIRVGYPTSWAFVFGILKNILRLFNELRGIPPN